MPSFRILQIVASLQGGAARHAVDLCGALRARGHDVTLAAPEDEPGLRQEIHASGLEFVPLALEGPLPLLAGWQLRRLLTERPWTHVHLHGHRAACLGRLGCIGWNFPSTVYTVHGYHPPFYESERARQWVNALERYLARYTDHYICVSEGTRTFLLDAVPSVRERCTVIENGIAPRREGGEDRQHRRAQLRREFGFTPSNYVIGSVARLQWQKGIDRLILAFSDLLLGDPFVRLLLVGDGPQRDELEDLVESYHMEERVIFAGQRRDSRDLYAAMDLFVLPSLWEGLPLTVLEAWDAGVPVVVTDVPGSRELVRDGVDGRVVDSSAQGLARTVLALRKAPTLVSEMIENGRERLEREFSLDRMTDQTEAVYRKLEEEEEPALEAPAPETTPED